jgi:DNA-binding PadR family transcriptional regulator
MGFDVKLLSRNEEMILLAVWRLGENAYGVTIRDEVSRVTGTDWTFGAIYVPLDTLTRKDYLIKCVSKPTGHRGGRSKCMYKLSVSGKQALKDIRQVQIAAWKDIPEIAFDEER